MTRHSLIWSASAIALVTGTALLLAGPLNPPAGPITSTYKTLTEVEPRIAINSTNTPGDADSVFRISSAGSYYLTGNVTAALNKSAIEIAASNVTIDLNGFSVTSLSTLASIRLTVGGRTNISIQNGNVGPGGGDGIDIAPNTLSTQTVGGRVKNVHVAGTFGAGIRVGDGVTVINCTSSNNTDFGIKAGKACVVDGCTAVDNNTDGISVGFGGTVTNCTANANTQTGILAEDGSTIHGCAASQNQNGIICAGRGAIMSNMCWGNSAAGIRIPFGESRVDGNVCASNATGILALGQNSFLSRNTCRNNATNWDIDSGNVCLVIQAVTSSAFSGNSGGVSPGSTNPNANYTY